MRRAKVAATLMMGAESAKSLIRAGGVASRRSVGDGSSDAGGAVEDTSGLAALAAREGEVAASRPVREGSAFIGARIRKDGSVQSVSVLFRVSSVSSGLPNGQQEALPSSSSGRTSRTHVTVPRPRTPSLGCSVLDDSDRAGSSCACLIYACCSRSAPRRRLRRTLGIIEFAVEDDDLFHVEAQCSPAWVFVDHQRRERRTLCSHTLLAGRGGGE